VDDNSVLNKIYGTFEEEMRFILDNTR